jgi:hypothetical protein
MPCALCWIMRWLSSAQVQCAVAHTGAHAAGPGRLWAGRARERARSNGLPRGCDRLALLLLPPLLGCLDARVVQPLPAPTMFPCCPVVGECCLLLGAEAAEVVPRAACCRSGYTLFLRHSCSRHCTINYTTHYSSVLHHTLQQSSIIYDASFAAIWYAFAR